MTLGTGSNPVDARRFAVSGVCDPGAEALGFSQGRRWHRRQHVGFWASTQRYVSGVTDPSYSRRRGHAGFTLLEMIVVIALMVIIAAMATLSFVGLEGESEVEKPGNELARMVKQANRAAVVQGRPFVIAFEKDGFGFLDGGGGADGHVTTPKGMKVSFQRWNGGKKWNSAEGLNWTFYPSGICDALRFKFEHPDGMVEMAFNPLTGSVSEEAAYLR